MSLKLNNQIETPGKTAHLHFSAVIKLRWMHRMADWFNYDKADVTIVQTSNCHSGLMPHPTLPRGSIRLCFPLILAVLLSNAILRHMYSVTLKI